MSIARAGDLHSVELLRGAATLPLDGRYRGLATLIGLEPIGPTLWQVYFGPTALGWLVEQLFVITDINGNVGRNPIC